MNYISFVISWISLSVIGGLFTYRLINTILEYLILPILDLSILPSDHFSKLNIGLNEDRQIPQCTFITLTTKNPIKYRIELGTILREFIIWFLAITILYLIAPKNFKQ